jgi:hypothetical protein
MVAAVANKLLFAANINMSGFSPIIAIAVFSGMIVKDKGASFLLPLVALFVSDVIIEILHQMGKFDFRGLYGHQWINYSLLLLTTLIGWALKGRKLTSVFLGALIAPTVFFLLSNFNVWYGDTYSTYPKSFSGLMLCYEAGLPFYKHALVATLIYLPACIIGYNLLVRRSNSVNVTLA